MSEPAEPCHYVVASDRWTQALEELQYTLGEGPEALVALRPVTVTDVRVNGERWPGFREPAAADGLVSAFAFPIGRARARLGDQTEHHKAAQRATHLAGTLRDILTSPPHDEEPTSREGPPDQRSGIIDSPAVEGESLRSSEGVQ